MEGHTNSTALDAKLEAFLFASGGEQKRSALARQLGCSEEALMGAIADLETRLQSSGLALVTTNTSVALVTSPTTAEAVAELQRNTLESEVGAAGLEVLSVLTYRGPSTRASIDYIRGVNSAATLRALTTRGLIERLGGATEAQYQLTPDALAHLGLRSASDAPEYETIATELAAFEKRAETETKKEDLNA